MISFDILHNISARAQTSRRWYYLVMENVRESIYLWEQVLLLALFGLLLVLVTLASIGSVSLFIVCGLIVALVVTALTIMRPQIALFLIFFGAGLPDLLIPLPGHTMRLIEAPLFLCVAIAFLRRPTIRLRLPHVLALLFFAIVVISFIHVPDVAQSLGDYGANKSLYAWLLIMLAFFGGTFLARYVKDLPAFLCLALFANLPFLLIGLAQSLQIHLPSLLIPSTALEVTQEGRLSGPSDSPTTFAFYLIDLLAVAVVCWTLGPSRWQRWTGGLFLLLIGWDLIGAGTRSALGAALLIVLLGLVVTRRFKWLCALILLAIPLTIIFTNSVIAKFTAHGGTSITNRFLLWQVALKLIAANPWIGIGLEQFPKYYAQLIVGQGAELNSAGISVHNQYLELALESGVIWLLAGLALLLSLIFVCWKACRRIPPAHHLAPLATILIALAYLVISFVDVPLDKPEGAVFFFLVAGLALGSLTSGRPQQTATLTRQAKHTFPDRSTQLLAPVEAGKDLDSRYEFYQPDAPLTLSLPTPYIQAARAAKALREPYIPLPRQLQNTDTLSLQLTAPMPRIRIDEASGVLQSVSKTGRAMLIQIISWAIAIPIVFPSTALMTHYFGPTQYGEYSFTLSILAICALCTMTGMDSWLIRHLSRQKRSTWSTSLGDALGARLLTSLIVSGATALIVCFLPLDSEQKTLLLLGTGTLLFSFSFNCLRAIYECGFVAEQQMSIISLLATLNRVVTAGLIVLAVLLHLSLIFTYILISYIDLPFFIILLVIGRRRFQMRLRFNLAQIATIVRQSLAFTGYDALALFSGQIDILLLLPLAGALSVGIYSLALRITNPLLTVAFAYVGALYPLLCARFGKGKQEFAQLYHEATRVLALGIIPLTLFVVVEAPGIVSLLAGGAFAAAVMPTRLLMISIALAFFSQLTLRACMAADKERSIPLISAVTLVITLLANALLIPHWQATGASMAALCAEFISLCLFSALLATQIKLWQTLGKALLILAGNLPGLAFLIWCSFLPLPVLATGFAALVLAGCVLTRTLSLNDARMAWQIVSARLNERKKSV